MENNMFMKFVEDIPNAKTMIDLGVTINSISMIFLSSEQLRKLVDMDLEFVAIQSKLFNRLIELDKTDEACDSLIEGIEALAEMKEAITELSNRGESMIDIDGRVFDLSEMEVLK